MKSGPGVHPVLVRASDFGSWDYCHKQYHLRSVLGRLPDSHAVARLEAGRQSHARHGTTVERAHTARRGATLLVLVAALLIAWLLLTGAVAPAAALPSASLQLVAVIAVVLAAAFLLSRIARTLGRSTGLPGAAEIVANDAVRGRGQLFVDRESGLVGKPDYLRRERTGGWLIRYVAAEVKPNRRRDTAYDGDVLQLLAYIVLTMAHFGSRAARYGYLAYANQTWRIEADEVAVQRVYATAQAMRTAHALPVVHRSHSNQRRCQSCSVRDQCSESLAR